MRMTVDSGDLQALSRDIAKLLQEIPGEVKKTVQEAGEEVKEAVQREAPVRTGRFRDSINVKMEGNDTAVIDSSSPIKNIIEKGTGPRGVKRKKVMAGDGQIFGTRVGPMPALKPFQKGFDGSKDRVMSDMDKKLSDLIANGVAGR